ncbi:MAG: inositol monophosphatase family protein [Desulfonatronovibrionaceae bacterium]
MDYSRLAEQTISITEQAGEIIREKWGEDRNIRKKGRIDLVTDTDTLCEEFLKEKLGAVLPQADFLAEESAGGGSTDSHLRRTLF